MKLTEFIGGIKPAPFKSRSLRSVIMATPIPERLLVPLLQYDGTTANCLLPVGTRVLKGQPLTSLDQPGVCPVHAPSSGIIEAITQMPVADEFAGKNACVVIRTDGEDRWIDLHPTPHWESVEQGALVGKIHAAGIVGLGGAGFPLAEKLRSMQGRPLATLIINAAECEPYITCDQALIRAHAAELITGIRILRHITAAEQVVIAIEDDKSDAIAALQKVLPQAEVRLALLPGRYPAGNEKLLIQQVCGTRLPAGTLPAEIGALVVNAGTAYAVFRAILRGEPLISRITTLCGDTLATPKNFEVLNGTPVSFLLELCGVDYHKLSVLLCGGSLMGFTIVDLSVPTSKTTNCLVAGSVAEFPPAPEPMECIRCGYCASACPVSLQPQLLYQYIRSDMLDTAEQIGVQDCIECGACAWVCPSHIPLLQYYRHAKVRLDTMAADRMRREHWQQRFDFHQYRTARQTKQREKDKAIKAATNITPGESALSPAEVTPLFDREKARADIAAAVERVNSRRRNLIASSNATELDGKDGQR